MRTARLALGALMVLLVAVPAAAAVHVGEAERLGDDAAQATAPVRGTGFVAWVDAAQGAPRVAVRLDGQSTSYALADNPDGTAIGHVAAHGHWVAWSQQNLAARAPGEQVRRSTWDLRVYDVDRKALVFDSASSDRNETAPALSDTQVAFLEDSSGVNRVDVADLRGSDAFLARPVRPGQGLQEAPAWAGPQVVFVEHTPAGSQVVAASAGKAQVLAPPDAARGDGVLAAWDGHVAWASYRSSGGSSVATITVVSLAGDVLGNWTWPAGAGISRLAGEGDLLAAEVAQDGRSVWAWCLGEQPVKVPTSGTATGPSVGGGWLAYLVLAGGTQLPQERTVSCSTPSATKASPAAGVAASVLALAVGSLQRRRTR